MEVCNGQSWTNLNQSDGNGWKWMIWGYAHFRKPPNGLAEQTYPPLV